MPRLHALLLATVILGTPALAQTDAPPAGDAKAGEAVFKQCAACHKIGPGATNSIGPELNGVVGRKAASVRGYSYSAAMKKSGLTWDEATLTKYLANPRQVVPGTKMIFVGLKKPKDIADVIAYLKQAGGTAQQNAGQK